MNKLIGLFVIQHINDLFELPDLNLLFIHHLPKTINEPRLFLEPTVLKLSVFQFLLGGLDALNGLEDLGCVEERDAGLDIEHLVVSELG